MELSYNQLSYLLKRYPNFELSYETMSQKGNLNNYNICMVIPNGKKIFVWNTYYNSIDISYLLELNREKKINKATVIKKYPIHPMSHGTIVYGTYIADENYSKNFMIIEDIYYYQGIFIKNIPYQNKLAYIKEYITSMNEIEHDIIFALPYMWLHENKDSELPYTIEPNVINLIGYVPHHLQYRSLESIVPYINVSFSKINLTAPKISNKTVFDMPIYRSRYTMDFLKPQYKYNTTFEVKADIDYDIYHLFAYGAKAKPIYYNVMYIPDYKTSVMLNKIFRKIRENDNLDYIEESDDEDDFQNTEPDKYVDLKKIVLFECKFHRKFKKWYPIINVPNNSRIVHINKLVNDYY
tara:strand:- start:4932 stop:5987 length:1056 start_codon:yes stop_codon:yes gene_type:complete